MEKHPGFKWYNQILFSVTVLFLLFIFSDSFLINLFFELRIVPTKYVIFFAALISVVVSYFLLTKSFQFEKINLLAALISAVILFVCSLNMGRLFIDVSWDGQAYHLEAIVKMFEGWNPFYQKLNNAAKAENIFINHYPRGAWYNSLSVFLLTENINSTKTFNYVLFFSAWLISTVTLHHFLRINFFASLITALIIATNPVVICQSASNYVDGNIYECMIIFFSFSIMLFHLNGKTIPFLIALIISILINYKFTSPFYLMVFIAGFITIYFFLKNYDAVKRIFYAGVVGFALGILFNGFSPYVTNLIEYQNPVYPIGDRSKKDLQNAIENSLQPATFYSMNRFQKLYQSVFSKAIWCRDPLSNEIKMPGIFTDDEEQNYKRPDGEMAGFGPYFSFALLFSLILIPVLFFANRKLFFVLIIALTCLIFSVFITKVGWLARYAPQFYIIGIIIPVALLHIRKKVTFFAAVICLSVYLYNNYTVFKIYDEGQKFYTMSARKQLDELAVRKETVRVSFGNFESNRELFREKGISFIALKSIKDLKCVQPNFLSWQYLQGATN